MLDKSFLEIHRKKEMKLNETRDWMSVYEDKYTAPSLAHVSNRIADLSSKLALKGQSLDFTHPQHFLPNSFQSGF